MRLRRFALQVAAFLCTSATHAEPLAYSQLLGWWEARAQHAGTASPVYVRFVQEGDKQSAYMSLPDIGAYDVAIGTPELSEGGVTMEGFGLSLKADENVTRLEGVLPPTIVPVYSIPVSFTRRAEAPQKPTPKWDAPQPSQRWRVDVGAPVWAGVTHDASSRTLLVATEPGVLHALDSKTGKTRWTLDAMGSARSRPAVIDGYVYLASDSGFLQRLRLRDGKEVWRARIDQGSPARLPTTDPKTRWDRFGSGVVTDGTRVYVGSRDKHVYAIDRKTGKVVWQFATNDLITATPAVSNGTVYAASFDGKVHAIDAANGRERWQYDAQQAIPGDVVVANGRVLVGSRSYDLIALDAATGREVWKHYYWFSWIESPPVVHKNTVYTGSSDATGVYAIDLATGKQQWKTHVPGWPWPRTAASDRFVVAGTVGRGEYLGNRNGSLAAIERASGTLKWLHLEAPPAQVVQDKLEWGFASSPVIADDVVYAADLQGRVYCFEL